VGDKKSAAHGGKGKRLAAINKPATKKHAGHSIEGTVTVDRRGHTDRRSAPDRRIHNVPPTVERRTLERRVKVNRRRQIDPTTCERDYTADEIEFMNAMDEYKRRNGRMFPTCSEVLEVVRSLGYLKRTSADPVAAPLAVDLFAGVAAASVAGG
jgi:hypothetical protein